MSHNISNNQLRVLRIIKLLKGKTMVGMSNAEIAHALDESPANITRALDALIYEGLATKLENGRFALSVQMLGIAQAHAIEMNDARAKIDELVQRTTASANS